MKKVILVTGASSGFGFDLVKALLEKDQIVYGASRNLDAMEPLKELGANIIKLDVTDNESVKKCIDIIIKAHQKIDVVFNNAGYGSYGAVEDVPIDEIQYQFDVNVLGVARINKAVLPFMREQKSGRIIMTSSLASHLSSKIMGWYSATKFTIRSMSTALRQELKPFNIQVIQIEPGIVNTAFEKVAMDALEQTKENSAYTKDINGIQSYLTKAYSAGPNSDSTVKAMCHAALSKSPKYVYRTTLDSKVFPILLKFLPNRLFDWIISRSY